MRHVLGIDDVVGPALDAVGPDLPRPSEPFTVGLLFVTSSLRTRVGFSVAAARLGGTPVPVDGVRLDGAMSAAESLEDTVRVLSGMVDVLVVRLPTGLERSVVVDNAKCPVVNGGDSVEHPTQALIDVRAIETFGGPLESQDVAIVGDLRMRSVSSLLRYFGHRPPRSLTLCCPPSRDVPAEALPSTAPIRHVAPGELRDTDVVVLAGLPERRGDDVLTADERLPYRATLDLLDRQPSGVVLLSPMPVVDEVDPAVRADPRNAMFRQSDLAVDVRRDVLSWCLAGR